jgi:phosphatidylcholine synthase
MSRLAWLAHAYTCLGLMCAGLTVAAGSKGDVRGAFLWMFLAILIDATDGPLARRLRVREALPQVDGVLLDNLSDFANYVLCPIFLLYALEMLPMSALAVGAVPLVASALQFSRRSAKTDDGFFTGFPSYWNLVVFYAWCLRPSPGWISFWLIALGALTFIPIRYPAPFRAHPLSHLTDPLCVVWGVSLAVLFFQLPGPMGWLVWVSLAYPAYYFAAALLLTARGR